MAKPRIKDENLPKEIKETKPSLIWLQCEKRNNGEIFCNTSEKFPFESVHELGFSCRNAKEYEDTKDKKILCEEFMLKMCESSYAYIIQKSFGSSHLETIINFIKNIPQNTFNFMLKEMIIVTDGSAAMTLGNIQKKEKIVNLKIRSSLFVGQSQASKVKPFRNFHDRVVLLENGIWHFGADVCGMHSSPYAFSGPWPDLNNSLKNFIEKLKH